MNEQQTEELANDVSDEVLEAAAGSAGGILAGNFALNTENTWAIGCR